MIDQEKFLSSLEKNGIHFFTGVPDSLLNEFCSYLIRQVPDSRNVTAANEGNAIGIASGYYLATGSIPLVYMQNSGLGNALNPLLSLTHPEVYSIPMVLLIGWRGDPGSSDWSQHKAQGRLTPVLLEDLGIPYREVVDDEAQIDDICTWAAHEAAKISAPVALLSKKGIMEKGKGEQEYPNPLDLSICREDAIELVIDSFSGDTVFVATTGRASRELFDIRRKRNESHERDFLNIGAMGHASQIALGLAIGQPNRRVICLDGDGAALMHLGGLAINAQSAGANYVHLIINNGVHESVGGQPSIGHSIDFTTMARAFGYKTLAGPVSNKADLLAGLQFAHDTDRPFFIDVHIKQGIRNDIPKLVFDEKTAKNSLMYNLNLGLLDNE